MKIPRKISPDNLKDSIVQVVFNSEPSPELLLGYVEQTLKGIFSFIAGASKRPPPADKKGALIFQEVQNGFFLSNDGKFKLNITSSTLVFNQQEKYSGWQEYFRCISETLQRLFDNNIIIDISRVGVRYISQFSNINVFESTYVKISLNPFAPNTGVASQFRTEIEEKEFKSIITLVNRNSKQNEIDREGIIDIDVIQVFKNDLNSFQDLSKIIENGHNKQKTIFFSIITDSFLNSLNPQY